MTKKFIIISFCLILSTVAIGWGVAVVVGRHNKFNSVTQAVPIVRYERFDESRNALIIGLFNPGILPMEIDRTELFYQIDSNTSRVALNIREYGDKPLVLDPGDTILVPLQKTAFTKPQTQTGSYWGQLEFRIPGQADFYSLRHRFNPNTFSE
jgi:hypothetical protein